MNSLAVLGNETCMKMVFSECISKAFCEKIWFSEMCK